MRQACKARLKVRRGAASRVRTPTLTSVGRSGEGRALVSHFFASRRRRRGRLARPRRPPILGQANWRRRAIAASGLGGPRPDRHDCGQGVTAAKATKVLEGEGSAN